MIYIRDDIPSILLTKHVFPDDIEGLFVELNFRKSKWLLMGAYHPPSQSDSYFFEHLDKALDIYSNYEKVLQEISTQKLQSLVWIPSYINMTWPHLLKKKTCFKSITNPTCIDLFLTNSNLSFQHTETVSTGLSGLSVVTALKTCFSKKKLRELEYRNYKNFKSVLFNEDLK